MPGKRVQSLPSLPPASMAQVYLDFDGTITLRDVLDELIVHYSVDDSWKQIEQQWQAGLIGSRECLSREFALLRISEEKLNAFLDQIAIDRGMADLLTLLKRAHVPVAVLSDGIDFFIKRILSRHGITGIPIRANSLLGRGGQWELHCPWASAACTSSAAHCKCESADMLRQPGRRMIYVGDGRSDLCPARKAEVVFAKGTLARCLAAEKRAFVPYSGLGDVARVLEAAWNRDGEAITLPARGEVPA